MVASSLALVVLTRVLSAEGASGNTALCHAEDCQLSSPSHISALAGDHLLLQLNHARKSNTAVRVTGKDCCGSCGGQGYCSPNSGSCYESKAKDYYQTCSAQVDCCGSCGGEGYCSPVSGTCYDSKKRDYYLQCKSNASESSESSESDTSCCSKCAAFCSPNSGTCYSSQAKDYYESCDATQQRKRIQVNGRQLLINGYPLHIKGICWGPTPKGESNKPDYRKAVEKDSDLMRDAGINVVRTYGTLADRDVLDILWSKGIWVVPTVYAYGGESTSTVVDKVNAVKDHPAILMWSIGNEWNYNGIYVHLSLWDSVGKLNKAARLIKEADKEHPVATIYGEIPSRDVFNAMPDIDLWGVNSYRGLSHGNLFNDFVQRSGKPMFMGEYGADAFNANVNREDQNAQAKATKSLTKEIVARSSAVGGDVLGGFLFEFNDEWWKDSHGSRSKHDEGGIAPGGGPYPDKTFNEEWWGIVDIDRKPRAAYWEYRAIKNPSDASESSESSESPDDEPADDATADAAEGECCSRCGGAHPFCSPKSGNCYSTKNSDYYQSCTTTTTTPCVGAHCTTIKIMSYNTEYKNYNAMMHGYAGKIRGEAPAIVGLQECQNRDGLASLSGYTANKDTGSQNYMLFDPSKVTFVSGGKLRIPRDDFAERFITWGQFRRGDAVIWFFNTHLPHNHNEARSQKTHARIAKMFLDKRKELGAENAPTIVVGDMNSHASNFNRVEGGGFESNLQANGFTWAYTARGNPGHGRIDQILYSTPHWTHSDCKDSGTGGSDHTSITCDLTLKVVDDVALAQMAKYVEGEAYVEIDA